MNQNEDISSLFILPNSDTITGGASSHYMILSKGKESAKHEDLTHKAVILVKATTDVEKIETLQSFFEQTKLTKGDILAVNGMSVNTMLESLSDSFPDITNCVFRMPPTIPANPTILHEQKLFLIIFHHVYFLAQLNPSQSLPPLESTFVEKFTAFQKLYKGNGVQPDGTLFGENLGNFREFIESQNGKLDTYLELLTQSPESIYDFFKNVDNAPNANYTSNANSTTDTSNANSTTATSNNENNVVPVTPPQKNKEVINLTENTNENTGKADNTNTKPSAPANNVATPMKTEKTENTEKTDKPSAPPAEGGRQTRKYRKRV
jgi:hypothetical protein